MVDRPIIFSGSMVRAIIAECKKPGTGKTQTRRYMNPQPYVNGYAYSDVLHEIACHNDWLPPSAMLLDVKRFGRRVYTTSNAEGWDGDLPYQVGDSLWVRETAIIAPAKWTNTPSNPMGPEHREVAYLADCHNDELPWVAKEYGLKKTPAIHMPRWASRITLSVTDVRVQRLQEINDSDAWAEGVTGRGLSRYEGESIELFRDLWDSINGKKPGRAWADNPWIVAVTFKPELRNIDAPVREIAA